MEGYGRTEAKATAGEKLTRAGRFAKWIKRDYACYLFLIPAFIGFFVFSVYPLIASLLYSFTDFNGVRITMIGTFNYEIQRRPHSRPETGRGVLRAHLSVFGHFHSDESRPFPTFSPSFCGGISRASASSGCSTICPCSCPASRWGCFGWTCSTPAPTES